MISPRRLTRGISINLYANLLNSLAMFPLIILLFCNAQEYTLAVFRETLRCFPAEPRLNKLVDADAVLTGTRFTPSDPPRKPRSTYDGGLTNVEIAHDQLSERKFSDIWAMHMNRQYMLLN